MGGTHEPLGPGQDGKDGGSSSGKSGNKSKFEAQKPFVSPKGDRF